MRFLRTFHPSAKSTRLHSSASSPDSSQSRILPLGFLGTVFSFFSSNCMQISLSSSALSKISRAVLRVRGMVVVECSFFSIPLKDLEGKPTGNPTPMTKTVRRPRWSKLLA